MYTPAQIAQLQAQNPQMMMNQAALLQVSGKATPGAAVVTPQQQLLYQQMGMAAGGQTGQMQMMQQ